MAYNVSRGTLTEILEFYIKLAKKNSGELVVLNKTSDEADEYVIRNIKDFNLIKTKKNDFLEVTVYDDDDDDIAYEEFNIGEDSDREKVREKILGIKSDKKNQSDVKEVKKEFKNKSENHFQKFIKKR
ncbi:MAG: hypothetical protein ACRCTS_06575 [Fusobacteriaceae bacterium]